MTIYGEGAHMIGSKRVAFMASARSVQNLFSADAERINSTHGGNTGNVAFVNAISSHLKGEVTIVPWSPNVDELREQADVVVIACANQVGPHTDLGDTARALDKAGLPIIAIGLGAQASSQHNDVTITSGTRRWLEVIASHAPSSAPNVGLRGQFTQDQISKLGLNLQSVVTGCPSNFTNLDFDFVDVIAQKLLQETRLVASAVGHPYVPDLAVIERQIIKLVDETEGTCIVQHDLPMIKLATNEFDTVKPSILEQAREYFQPLMSMDDFKVWCRKRLVVFGNADNWMAWTRRYDFVVGPRFHGVMLAIQAGVPAGCIAHDSRTLEMCETMDIPVRMYDTIREPLSTTNLHKQFLFDPAKYRSTRASLAMQYLSILQGAGLNYDRRLDAITQPALASAAD